MPSNAVTFDQLRLPPELIAEMAAWGVTCVDKLALLAAAAWESPSADPWDRQRIPPEALLRKLCSVLHERYVTQNRPDLRIASEGADGLRTWRLSIRSSNMLLSAAVTLPESDLGAALGAPGRINPAAFEMSLAHRPTMDPLAEVQRAVDNLPPRLRTVLAGRLGLDGLPPATLAAIGDRLGITRERVRQISLKAIAALQHAERRQPLSRIYRLIEWYAANLQVPPADPVVAHEIENDFPSVTRPTVSWLRLLGLLRGPAWDHPGDATPSRMLHAVVAVTASSEVVSLPDLAASVARMCSVESNAALAARIRHSGAIEVVDGQCRLVAWPTPGLPLVFDKRLRRLHTMIGILQRDGPSHFTHLAREVNNRMIRGYEMTPRDVHAWLDRYDAHFVWAGPGVYGLRSHNVGRRADTGEAELPVEYQPSRRRGIADEIVILLLEHGPLPLGEIERHVLPRFVVRRASVQAAIVQDTARRFVVQADGTVRLRGGGAAQGLVQTAAGT